ncbi:MAG: class II aldolase/adducin family protein [Anaerolineae bacterium]|nr:class II aldolase/adducin family protein [Anaerolineae bacterium]
MTSIPEQIIYAGRLLFERKLLDMAGGNISARHGDTIYVTARYSGSQRHWQNRPEDILAGSVHNDELLSRPEFSREGKAHLAIYRHFPMVKGIIHAHPFHILPFCAAGRPIEPVLEQTQKFGLVKVIEGAPAHTQVLADNIVAALKGQEEVINQQAAAVLMPRHGIMVAGKNLLAAVDALERLDWNAYCIMAQKLLA